MKRLWQHEELVKHFTLLPEESVLLANKTGSTRLGFAVLLKFFRYESRKAPEAINMNEIIQELAHVPVQHDLSG